MEVRKERKRVRTDEKGRDRGRREEGEVRRRD